MIRKLLGMFGRGHRDPAEEERLAELDRQIDEQRQLRRLAQSEFIDNLFSGVVNDLHKREPHQNGPGA